MAATNVTSVAATDATTNGATNVTSVATTDATTNGASNVISVAATNGATDGATNAATCPSKATHTEHVRAPSRPSRLTATDTVRP